MEWRKKREESVVLQAIANSRMFVKGIEWVHWRTYSKSKILYIWKLDHTWSDARVKYAESPKECINMLVWCGATGVIREPISVQEVAVLASSRSASWLWDFSCKRRDMIRFCAFNPFRNGLKLVFIWLCDNYELCSITKWWNQSLALLYFYRQV